MDPLNCIELTLKTPNQRFNDIQLKCQEDWTVKRLKEYLEDVYPSKPKSSAQKLIYLGKLLQDHVKLKEVFSSWSARTLHIVCHDTQSETQTQSTQETASSSSTPSCSSEENDSSNTDGIRHRSSQQAHTSTPPNLPTTPQMPNSFAQQHQHYHQQWNQQYQMQMQQYYMQMQQWQHAMASGQWPYQQPNMYNMMHNPPTTPSTTNTPPVTPSTPTTPAPAAPQPEQPEQPPVRQPAEANRNVPMNAGPGGAIMQDNENDENNPANRDWLDWLYMSMRGLMLMSIVYFYSSTSRFLLVAILGFIVYLYQTGWFTPRRVEQPVEIQPPTPQPNRDEVDGNQENTEENNENNTTELNNEQPQTPVEPPRPSAFKVFCTFIISFVTSLVPATAPPLQQN